ncbi:MAG: glycosyltransferase family 4 protein [Psychroserpens sp.]|uniref:glycosyltransferase family 4 protein n=1 Tax=Psychroserpens sp. TaxID=2020870 RepID=UPI003C7FC3FF
MDQITKNKKVLAFIDWYRPGFKAGGTITAFGNFVDHLEHNFTFKIVTRNTDYLSTQPYAQTASDVWGDKGRTKCYYISKLQLSMKLIRNLVKDEKFHILYINGIFSFYFSILPLYYGKGKKIIINPHGMLSKQAFSVKSTKKKFFIGFANAINLYKNSTFHVANADEAKSVRNKIKNFRSIKIANQFPRKIKSEVFQPKYLTSPLRLVNVARISTEKGTLKMIKSLHHSKNNIILDIFGPIYDKQYWSVCNAAIKELPPNITVNYRGVIDGNSVVDMLREYHYFILFSEGENFGHSILEALSTGCPVVISNNTPWRDLESKGIGWDIDIDIEKKIVYVFERIFNLKQDEYDLLSKKAFNFAKDFSNDKNLLAINKSLINNI